MLSWLLLLLVFVLFELHSKKSDVVHLKIYKSDLQTTYIIKFISLDTIRFTLTETQQIYFELKLVYFPRVHQIGERTIYETHINRTMKNTLCCEHLLVRPVHASTIRNSTDEYKIYQFALLSALCEQAYMNRMKVC